MKIRTRDKDRRDRSRERFQSRNAAMRIEEVYPHPLRPGSFFFTT